MAVDPNPELRDKLLKALEVLNPEIRGLRRVENDPLSAEAFEAVENDLAALERRRFFIHKLQNALDQVVGALEALTADGWPDPVPPMPVSDAVFRELQQDKDDIGAGIKTFVVIVPQVSGGIMTFPEFKDIPLETA